MPVYTYHCDNCDHVFDKQQSFTEEALKKCPACGKVKLHKVYKPAQVVFKGSGYYVTDSKGRAATLNPSKSESNGKSDAAGTGESNGSSEKKSETSSETKADAKPESKPETKAESKTEKPASKPAETSKTAK